MIDSLGHSRFFSTDYKLFISFHAAHYKLVVIERAKDGTGPVAVSGDPVKRKDPLTTPDSGSPKYLVGESNPGSLVESQTDPQCKPLVDKAVMEGETPACAAACAQPEDPDLARVVAAWPALPDAIKRAVLALIGSP